MSKKSFQDSMDWDDIMLDKQPNATGTASEWNNFSVPQFTGDAAKNSTKPQTSSGNKELSSNKVTSQKESRKGSKKSSMSSSSDRRPDSPTDDDDKSRVSRKPSSTKQSSSKSGKNESPKREERRLNTMKHHDDSDSDSDDDDRNAHSKSRRTPHTNSKESAIHRSPSVSRRKERKTLSVDKDDESIQDISSKLKRDKRTGDSESKRETRKHGDDSSVRHRDKSPTSRGERSRVSKDDDTVNDKDQKKSKTKKEKSRKSDDHDDDKSLASHRREVSTRKSRSTTIDDKLDDQSHCTRDSSRVRRSRNGQLNAEQLSQSRQRAVQRMEARNNWRESQRKPNTTPTSADTAETPLEDDLIDTRRTSLLDQSRRGPIRSFRCNYDDDDDDDDFSVLSGMTSSSFTVDDTLDAPFVAKIIKNSVSGGTHPTGSANRGGGGYLPNSLNNPNNHTNESDPFQKKERRPSAFGTGYERAMALNCLKSELDNDSDEEGSSYALPTGLSRSAGTHFEIDRSGRGASTRRPSLSTTLTVPCINGIDDSDNDDDIYSKSSDRRGSLSSKEFDQSSRDERRGSMTSRNVDYESDSNSKKTGANYDSTMEDMLKSRRLRGARGDAAKKKEETKSAKKSRGFSILTNLVHSATKTTPETSAVRSSTHRRASTTM